MGAKRGARGGESTTGDPMRTPILLLCLALAGCAGAESPATLELAAEAAPAAPAASRASQASNPHALNAQASAKKNEKKEEWWKEGGVTREKINAMCWMKYENGRKDLPIDKRADLVDACVQQALKEHPIR
jgi:hypothetical protein